jgi:hypothetical protein
MAKRAAKPRTSSSPSSEARPKTSRSGDPGGKQSTVSGTRSKLPRAAASGSPVRSGRKGVYIGVQRRGVFALPADMRKRHHLDEPGAQLLVIEREDGVLELHPQLAVPAEQKWFWTQRWQAMEAEADEQIATGDLTTHDSADELFAHLDGLQEQS